MPGRTVLITGAAGFIGSHLAERCLSLGWRVVAVDCFTDYYAEPLKRQNLSEIAGHPACTVIEADILDLDLTPILDAANIVFHLAAQPGVRASWDDFYRYNALNVDATQKLLECSSRSSLERFVLASSSSVYGNADALPTHEEAMLRPVSPYGITKLAAEHLARVYWQSFGVPAVSLRYFTVYGPRQRPDMAFNRLIERALLGEPFEVFGDGNQTRDFTYVADAVDATIAAGQHGRPGFAYNIGGGSRRSLASVCSVLGELMGARVPLKFSRRQRGDACDTAADIGRARQDLGYEPTFSFDEGLRAQLDWQRATAALQLL